MFLTLLLIVAAYLIGSISSAILICKIAGLPDPRTLGSKNPGATNVLRIGSKTAAASVLLFDIFKGTIPVWSGYFLGVEPLYLGFVAIAACLGHMFPIFFGFKGGKAVATAFGVLLPINTYLALLIIFTWLFVARVSRYSSLAAIVTVALAPWYTWLIKPVYTLPVFMLAVLIIIRHHGNIMRLIRGNERKIFEKGDRTPASK